MGAWVASGREALAAGRWVEARAAFHEALNREASAEAFAGLGEAAWWLGETTTAVEHFESAFAAYLRSGRYAEATFAATNLYFTFRISLGWRAVARGWLHRAARLVDENGLTALAGWVLLITAHDSDDVVVSERAARGALERAAELGDTDLELCARSQLGACLVQQGDVAGGVTLLSETLAGALAGEGSRLQTVVYTSCNTVTSCSRVADVATALQWVRATAGFTDRYGCPHVFTLCRIHHARLLFATGDWSGAAEHFEIALRTGREAEPALHGEALAGLAELRVAEGRLEDAAELLRSAGAHPSGTRARAAWHLAHGEPGAATALLERRLLSMERPEPPGPEPYRAGASAALERGALLGLLASAEAAIGDAGAALDTAERLSALAEEARCDVLVAEAWFARAEALLASGQIEDAVGAAERSLAVGTRLGLPFDAARSRLLLARAWAATAPDGAALAARAALDTFEDLGAGPDADRAAALLRSLGVRAARRGPSGVALLTKREREVLEILANGHTNRAIAARLHLSPRTVEHHVQSILSKLGLRNRAAAAAFAARELGPED